MSKPIAPLSAARLTRIAEIPAELLSAQVALVCSSERYDLNATLAFASLAAQHAIAELLAEAAALRTQLAEAEEARKADLRGLLLEWKDSSEPDPTEFGDNTAMFAKCKAAFNQFFELKARSIGAWPLEEPAAGIQEKGGAAA